ncbi:DnaJ C-terminal domain-containing protein [Polaromonas sp. SM01]|uniref:DnaJ C-terminal domain-containing protein n=1 Tax=Polaromonas sp. SM01 TaxID=3085630 RepID=UPI0029822EEE|nr:DnaJ C-terminal domain-containing protein [Polaromonas sp. SM01]MDW5442994.1 DnaJ C-terminal domain-containing protein [Polaromonas sp. SM01]
MEFKDYYETVGVTRDATPEDIKRAYRKLARKYHPDVSKEKNAEARFKEVAEAYEVLSDPDKRAAYDQLGANHQAGQDFRPPPEWAGSQSSSSRSSSGGFREGQFGGQGADHSEFFESLFRGMGGGRHGGPSQDMFDMHGQDQHAKIQISIEDSYNGATRTLQLRTPQESSDGRVQMQDRSIEFVIPKGIRAGQHIRLAAQGAPGMGQGSPGDLYLDVAFLPHQLYRAEGHDVYMDLPVAPWEAALGAEVEAPTPTGRVEVKIPAGSATGRKLRLKGRGLPGKTPGDFYYVLQITLPPADTDAAKSAYQGMAAAFKTFNPRAQLEGQP